MARSKRKRPAGDDIGVPLPPLAPVNDETQTSAQVLVLLFLIIPFPVVTDPSQQVKRARQTTSDEDGVSRQVCLLLDEVLQRNISVQGNDIVHKIVPHLLPKVGTDGILALLNIIVKLDQPDGLHQSDETVGEHSGGGCAVPDMSFTLPNKPAQPELRKVSMGLTDNISPAIMTERLLDFMLCLNELRVVMKANGKPSLTGFTLEQKHQLCNIVLNDIMGARAISHLEKLVCEHDKCMQKEPNEELALRTNNLTNDHAKPDELREFFYYILAQLGMRQKPKSLTQKLHHMIYKYKVVKRFLALEELVKIPDGELRQYLESIGNGPAHGKGWDVCLVQYLNEELGYDPKSNKLNNLMQHGRVMEGLIDEFGLAIICLFTSRDINM